MHDLSLIVVLKRHTNVITHSYNSLTSYFPFGNLLISRKDNFEVEEKRVEESFVYRFIYRLKYMFPNIIDIVYC